MTTRVNLGKVKRESGAEDGDKSGGFVDRVRRSIEWRYRMATAGQRALPDFVILGAQRSGTTYLFGHLIRHPQVIPPFRKEIHYYDLHYERGEEWYRANFPLLRKMRPGDITGCATPNYLSDQTTPGRMQALTPDVKLIVVFRHPVDRAHSAWRFQVMRGIETLSFEDALQREREGLLPSNGDSMANGRLLNGDSRFRYLGRGRYAEEVKPWLGQFPTDHFHFIASEELFDDPAPTLHRLGDFLGVDRWDPVALPAMNRAAPDGLDPELRQRLTEYFIPYNRDLETLVGRRFEWE
jgi:hypothetical protein